MPSRINVQNTHKTRQTRELHDALIDIMSVMNRPQGDEDMVRDAGIALDRALFPLLVVIERRGPIGIVDLADAVGRDHTTVSRQVAKLESLDLVARQASEADRRVRLAVIAPKGKAMTEKVDAVRDRNALAIFEAWDTREVDDLVRLMRKLADAMKGETDPDG